MPAWGQDEIRAHSPSDRRWNDRQHPGKYDFAIYGYFAAQIGCHFFPHEDAVAQLLSTFGIFAVGYLMRPLAPSRSRNISGLLACGCGLIYGYYHLIGTNRLPAAQASLLLQHMSEERTNDQDTKRARHENKP